MKICVISDLHIDQSRWDWDVLQDHPADLVIVAGDISNDIMRNCTWLAKLRTIYPKVLWIAGNHDYYNSGFHETRIYTPGDPPHPYYVAEMREHYRQFSEHHDIHFLDPGSVTIDGVTFVGATGWHDYVAGEPYTREQQISVWHDYINDRFIRWNADEPSHVNPCQAGNIDAAYLDQAVARATGPCVAITHHIPHRSLLWQKPHDPIWTAMHGSFANTQLEKIQSPDLKYWIYGHTHARGMKTINGCKYVCNARGYPGENSHWEPVVFDIT